jgi:hypothetical protein
VYVRLKKVTDEQKEEKADPMLEMMQRIRSGNVGLKKVATPPPVKKGGGVMAEMAQLLVRMSIIMQRVNELQSKLGGNMVLPGRPGESVLIEKVIGVLK